MKYYLSALYDKELKEYHLPLCFSNAIMVRRHYELLLSRYLSSKEHYGNPELDLIVKHISNYQVVSVGEFDTSTGLVSSAVQPEVLFELAIFDDMIVKAEKVDNKD